MALHGRQAAAALVLLAKRWALRSILSSSKSRAPLYRICFCDNNKLHFNNQDQYESTYDLAFLCYERVHSKITRLEEILYVQFGGSKCYLNLGEHSFSRLFPVGNSFF